VSQQESDGPDPALVARALPYLITDEDGVEIARACSPQIAFAMFRSALAEHPSRTLFLRDGVHLMIQRFA
jgi:hypothetical protein